MRGAMGLIVSCNPLEINDLAAGCGMRCGIHPVPPSFFHGQRQGNGGTASASKGVYPLRFFSNFILMSHLRLWHEASPLKGAHLDNRWVVPDVET